MGPSGSGTSARLCRGSSPASPGPSSSALMADLSQAPVYDGIVRVRDAATGRLLMSLTGPAGFTTAHSRPTSDELVIGRDVRSRVFTWPLSATGEKLVAKLPEGQRDQRCALRQHRETHRVCRRQGRRSQSGILRSGRVIRLGGAPKVIEDVRVVPDGQHVAAATAIGKVLIWRLDRPNAPSGPSWAHGDINSLAYSPNGRIVTAGTDRTVRVWNPAKGTQVILRGHRDEVNDAVFTCGGSQVLSASADGTLRLWDANSGNALAVLQSGGGPLWDVAVSRDGKIATLSSAGVIRVFNCEVCGSLDQVRALARSRSARSLSPQERQRFLAGTPSVYPEGSTPASARREFRCLQKLCLPRSTSHASHRHS